MRLVDIGEERRGRGYGITAVDLADTREREVQALLRTRHRDIKEPPLLFFVAVGISTHALVREEPLLHPAHEHCREFEPFRRVDGHERDARLRSSVHLVLVAR